MFSSRFSPSFFLPLTAQSSPLKLPLSARFSYLCAFSSKLSMKISYNWLKQYISITQTPEEISQILTGTGLEVELLEKVLAIPGGLEGLVIGYVKECVQHPNADRLRITKVDAGAEELQIICGAANVAAGQKVVIATVGTTVYPTAGEPFKINKSKIRGEVSEGMICAEDEIGLGTDHAGIMVLDNSATIGTPAKKYFKLEDDYLFEIGLTPNRADAASHLGTARDIAAYLKTNIILPDVASFTVQNNVLPIEVEVLDATACPRYSSLTISGIEVKESPDWLKQKLGVIGLRPINNVVDATNYVLHSLGQPMHAFDADTIKGNKVLVKTCAEGTVFKTLDGVERKLSADDLMICNAEGPMTIAGVFGGMNSGVSLQTKNIFLESAYFDAVSVRKTAKHHSLKTDASFRYERGTDPEITVFALKYAALLIQELAGGTVSSEISDFYPKPIASFIVQISYKHVNRLIGKTIPVEEIKSILKALDIKITAETEDGLSLEIPSYRVDVTREVDVIEEILRIYGYNNIEIPTQICASLNNAAKPDKDAVQNMLANLLTANGFNEILANSLTKSAYADDLESAVKILNPLSSDLDVMRQTLLFSGLEVISYNQNRKYQNLKLYEFGKIYHRYSDKFEEKHRLSIFLSGDDRPKQWDQKEQPVSFYQLKAAVDTLLQKAGIRDFAVEDATGSALDFGLNYKTGSKNLVVFGAVAKKELKKADVNQPVFYADFDFDLMLKQIGRNKIVFQDIPKFPAVKRDLSLLVDERITFNQLKQTALKTERKLIKEITVFDVYKGDKISQGKKSYALSFVLQDEEKTLVDKVIDAAMQKVVFNLQKEAGAEVRK